MAKLRIGTTIERVEAAERALGLELPEPFRQALMIANRFEFECVGDRWLILPVWDSENPRRTASHIAHENASEQRWPGMADDLLVIGKNGTADCLVLRTRDGVAGSEVLLFDHETREVSATGADAHGLHDAARGYARSVEEASRA